MRKSIEDRSTKSKTYSARASPSPSSGQTWSLIGSSEHHTRLRWSRSKHDNDGWAWFPKNKRLYKSKSKAAETQSFNRLPAETPVRFQYNVLCRASLRHCTRFVWLKDVVDLPSSSCMRKRCLTADDPGCKVNPLHNLILRKTACRSILNRIMSSSDRHKSGCLRSALRVSWSLHPSIV